ncbi:MAG: ATP synthase F0 subunit B [Bdellovibrionaceae bacterium]|nr:ATP synthase F0 subunit B [Pseudobdellovibrionaceae bacterium]
MAIFLVAFTFLKYFIFGPYLAAYIERRKRTVGHADVAKEMNAEIASLEAEYSVAAKGLNEKIKAMFNEKKALGAKEATKIIEAGHTSAQQSLNEGKKSIDTAFGQAREEMKGFVPSIGDAMVERLIKS